MKNDHVSFSVNTCTLQILFYGQSTFGEHVSPSVLLLFKSMFKWWKLYVIKVKWFVILSAASDTRCLFCRYDNRNGWCCWLRDRCFQEEELHEESVSCLHVRCKLMSHRIDKKDHTCDHVTHAGRKIINLACFRETRVGMMSKPSSKLVFEFYAQATVILSTLNKTTNKCTVNNIFTSEKI